MAESTIRIPADVVTSKLVSEDGPLACRPRGEKEILRDVSWHPYEPSLVSAGFDGYMVEWGYDTQDLSCWTQKLPKPRPHSRNYW